MMINYYYLKDTGYVSLETLANMAENAGEYFGIDAAAAALENELPVFGIDLPARGISKKAAEKIRIEITNKLVSYFQEDKNIFRDDIEIIKKAALLIENARQAAEKRGYPFTLKECKDYYGYHFTLDHTGKMSGMISGSTACKANKFCIARINNPGFVCFGCFADEQLDNYGLSMLKPFLYNLWLLNNFSLPDIILPCINALQFRFESFGDILTPIQQYNYFAICYNNPRVIFAQWSKNPNITKQTIFRGFSKPENMIYIYSNPVIDLLVRLVDIKKKFPFVDKVFSVWTAAGAKKAGIKITCGARHCLSCRHCYEFENGYDEINELYRPRKEKKSRKGKKAA